MSRNPFARFDDAKKKPLMSSPTAAAASDDPFYAFREEVQARVDRAKVRLAKWRDLLDNTNTATTREWSNENAGLKRDLSAVGENIDEMDKVVSLIKNRRANFPHIDDNELMSRQRFVVEMRQELGRIKDVVGSKRTQGKLDRDKRELLHARRPGGGGGGGGAGGAGGANGAGGAGGGNRVARSNADFIRGERQQQEQIVRRQDQQLGQLEQSVGRLGDMAIVINDEITEQGAMLDELDADVDKVQTKMDVVVDTMGKMLKTKDKGTMCMICTLFLIVIVMAGLVAWT